MRLVSHFCTVGSITDFSLHGRWQSPLSVHCLHFALTSYLFLGDSDYQLVGHEFVFIKILSMPWIDDKLCKENLIG